MGTDTATIERAARERLGLARLRPGQGEAVRALLAGRDTLAIMPTGSGKSAIYQLAGLLLAGPTIVISPLLALQRDQVASLAELPVGGAAEVNSLVPAGARAAALDDFAADDLEFLFLAPEQLGHEATLDRLRAARPSLVVVDEAHCVSEWGHDFRPAYGRLGAAIAALGHPTTLALTATAAPPVRDEIVRRLGLRDPLVLVRGFDRPNLRLGVERHASAEARDRALLAAVAAEAGPGIVYTATRKRAEELARALAGRGLRAAPYHAGLRPAARERAQDAFMRNDLAVIVATIAFGMGVDKPDIRFVHHAEPSGSLDAYYQEIGRAGRDGDPARITLFYRPEDLGLHRFFAGGGRVGRAELASVARATLRHDGPIGREALRAATKLSRAKLAMALDHLVEAAVLAATADDRFAPGPRAAELRAALRAAAEAEVARRTFERSRLAMMQAYAEAQGCRRVALLGYFGEEYAPPCGACDRCAAGVAEATPARESAGPFPSRSRVRHAAWGDGLVLRYEGEKVLVLFDTVGYKTLATELAIANGLLASAE